jgi:hypothetical protein
VQTVIPTPADTALSCRTSSGQHVTTALPQVARQPSAQPPDLPFTAYKHCPTHLTSSVITVFVTPLNLCCFTWRHKRWKEEWWWLYKGFDNSAFFLMILKHIRTFACEILASLGGALEEYDRSAAWRPFCGWGRAMAATFSRQFLTADDLVRTPVSPCRFVVNEAALGQVTLRVLPFFPVGIILPAYLGGRAV